MASTLVLGIGNLLMGDEGVGVHVARHLQEGQLLDDVEVLDGGTGGFHLLGHMQSHDRVLLVDATMDGRTPGTIRMLEPRYATDYPPSLSAHDIGLKDLLEVLYLLDAQTRIVLFTVSVEKIDGVTLDLSDEIKEAIPRTADAIREYLTKAS